MRVYLRTSRRTGISMPWWLALIAGAIWLTLMALVLFYGLIAMVVLLLVRTGWTAWRKHHPRQ